jgi:large subunit ribosomal protein L29
MKLEEIRGKPDGELKTALDTQREELWKMKFQGATEPIDNPGKIREARKLIARIEGELRARELKTVREKMHAELGSGPKSTRELAKSFGGSIERARREALRLVRAGEVVPSRRGAPAKGKKAKAAACCMGTRNLGAKVWALKTTKSAGAAGGKK